MMSVTLTREVVSSVQPKVSQPSPQLPEKKQKMQKKNDECDHYQGGGVFCPAKSVSAFGPAAVELWRKRGKPFTIQVKFFAMTWHCINESLNCNSFDIYRFWCYKSGWHPKLIDLLKYIFCICPDLLITSFTEPVWNCTNQASFLSWSIWHHPW